MLIVIVNSETGIHDPVECTLELGVEVGTVLAPAGFVVEGGFSLDPSPGSGVNALRFYRSSGISSLLLYCGSLFVPASCRERWPVR